MIAVVLLALLAVAPGWAQETPPETEEDHLRRVLAEAGASPVDFARALETHLDKYPKTDRKAELERALVKAAIDAKDEKRILEYGVRVLEREPDDLQILDRVTRALLSTDDAKNAGRALRYAKRWETVLRRIEEEERPNGRNAADMREDIDRSLGRALAFQARATGNLGRHAEAADLARRAYDTYPSAEAAREAGRWLARLDKTEEAVRHYADAFTIADPLVTEEQRAVDRARLGELYRKTHESEKGLGDAVLEAYDRTSALMARRRAALRELDPNAELSNPMEFTLSGLKGDKLRLSSLKGSIVVLDFWATWCGPCRTQQPLYEQVKEKFRNRKDVVFLNINTDENREVVGPFLEKNAWNKTVYFDDGLAKALRVSSIPTTIVFNKQGELVSRMNGFIPERFVDMLSNRIRSILAEP